MRTRLLVCLLLCASVFAQQTASAPATSVPHLIRFTGTVKDVSSHPLSGTVGITFTLYLQQFGGSPIWSEVQNVKLDDAGRYNILLGATKSDGLPIDLFTSGEAQWLGVRVERQPEQPRVLLVSVPYAMKAAAADTLAGHTATDFITIDKLSTVVKQEIRQELGDGRTASGAIANALSGSPTNFTGSTTDQIVGVTQSGSGAGVSSSAGSGYALFGKSGGTAIYGTSTATATTGYGVYGTSTSPTGYGVFGSNTATTGTAVGIRGNSTSTAGIAVYGTANTASGTATGVKGITQSPDGYGVFGQNTATTGAAIGFRGSTASTNGVAIYGTATAATGNTTGLRATVASANGTAAVFLNSANGKLLSGQSGAGSTEVFSVTAAGDLATSGQLNVAGAATFASPITFSAGQTFPGATVNTSAPLTGNGSVASPLGIPVATTSASGYLAASDWTTFHNKLAANGDGSLLTNVNAAKLAGYGHTDFAKIAAANTFTGNQTVNGNLSATGWVSGAGYLVGGNPIAFGSYANNNAFLGFGGNTTMTGTQNTAVGGAALIANTTGSWNTSIGHNTLNSNQGGSYNTAVGEGALTYTNNADWNVGVGTGALFHNVGGVNNTGIGSQALNQNHGGGYNTAVGSGALYANDAGGSNTALGWVADVGSGNLTNATAIGAQSYVTQSNSLVLGSIAGVHDAANSTNVGIGTTAPAYRLDVNGSARFTQPVVFSASQTFPGTITGITTAAGSGLTGGATSGTLNMAVDGTVLRTSGTYANPAWLTTLAASKITGLLTKSQLPTTGVYADQPNNFVGQQSATATGSFAILATAPGSSNCAAVAAQLGASSGFNCAAIVADSEDSRAGIVAQNFSSGTGTWAARAFVAATNHAESITAVLENAGGGTILQAYGSGTTPVFTIGGSGATTATSLSVPSSAYNAVYAATTYSGGNGIVGEANTGSSAYAVWGKSSSGYAGYFSGNVNIVGSLSKSSGSFKIDHPLDPANKYLYHSFVESPDMMNIYNGIAVLDGNGEAVVVLPNWFEALNRDFRYQLTSIGAFMPVYIAEEISGNTFTIAGGTPGKKVSWQVTGIRQDPWAEAHRIPVEQDKAGEERGKYIHPELYQQPETANIEYNRVKALEVEKANRAARDASANGIAGIRIPVSNPATIPSSSQQK